MRLLLIGVGLLALSMSVAAREDKDTKGDDQEFVHKASAAGMAEVNLGKIATRRAHHTSVKEFAEKMVTDHSKANKELISLADRKKFKVATRMNEKHHKMSEKLSTLEGDAFDREYMAGMVKDHEAAVSLFEKQSANGKDEELRSWAKKTLPDLKHHLEMARKTRDKVKK